MEDACICDHYYVSPLESYGADGVSDSSYYALPVLKSSKWKVRERGKGKVWFGTGEYLPWLACGCLSGNRAADPSDGT